MLHVILVGRTRMIFLCYAREVIRTCTLVAIGKSKRSLYISVACAGLVIAAGDGSGVSFFYSSVRKLFHSNSPQSSIPRSYW
jgi:hypothetical protein